MSDDPGHPESEAGIDEAHAQLPDIADGQAGEIVVALQPEGLLIGGDPEAIEPYVSRIRDIAGQTFRVAGIDKASLTNSTGLLTSAASFFGQSGKFVQLHPDSLHAIEQHNLIPGTDGFFRMMTRGADKKFIHQLQWKPTAVNPAQLISAQMIAVQLALKTAVAEVEEAVRRVEGKVDQVLKLAQAHRTDDVFESFGAAKAIDGFRFFSVRDLTKYRNQLQQDLDDLRAPGNIRLKAGKPWRRPAFVTRPTLQSRLQESLPAMRSPLQVKALSSSATC